MKPTAQLTIEKLKLVMDSDNGRSKRDITAEYVRKIARRTNNSKASCARALLHCAVAVLDPFLPSDATNSDGRIASVVYLICLTTTGLIMNMTSWLQQDSNVTGITTDHIDGFLITCICPALLWILYMFCKQNDRQTIDFISSGPHSHRPLMAGAYVFGAGSSIVDISHITFYLKCSHNTSSLIFSFLKAIFILTQILFLRKFANATIHRSQCMRLNLFHILGTNICIWFRALFSHARLLFKADDVITSWCAPEDIPMTKIWNASEPYLYPFTMEYSLIAGGMLYTMWSGLRDLHPDPQDIYIYDEMQDSDDREKLLKISHQLSTMTDDRSPFISPPQSQLTLHSGKQSQTICNSCHDTSELHEIKDTYKPSSDPGFLFGILLSILLYISIAFLWIDKDSLHALRFYYSYQIFIHTVIIVCLWLILKALQVQQPAWYPYNSDDLLLIVSFVGVFLYTGLSFAAAISEVRNYHVIAMYSLAKSSLILIESMLQVTAIIKSLRFRPTSKRTHTNFIRQGALILLTTNLALWGQDSFFELRDMVTTPVQAKLFGELAWRAVTIFAYPLCIFFRFHAVACLFEVWASFRYI